ncbi:MAG TPA: ATP phosphoribosyltransferase regulatory subunit [Pyrinomonadaceae bacterium]|jgi:histidyl-tRNA synthetase
MTKIINNDPIEGTIDTFGVELRKIDFLFRKFTDVINRYGYEQLEVPLIERATSFSEDIVGQSPWPEWDKRGCFYLKINNYLHSFENIDNTIDALLIPEGTIPVTRWLGKYLDSIPDTTLPLKVFYKLPCFRNELIDSLSETKRRQFNQFGIEILGSNKLASDVEIIYLIKRLLVEVGVPSSQIRIRISNVGIFNKLIRECQISKDDSISLKEAMDTIAECRAGKKPERKTENEIKFKTIVDKYSLTNDQEKMWSTILNHKEGIITSSIYETFEESYKPYLDELTLLCNELITNDVNSMLDLCVVRSHEYYTGISFEVDVNTPNAQFIEIAGGGRYDKLVGSFVKQYKQDVIPSTGFAFGLERVVALLETIGMFNQTASFMSTITFDKSNADTVIVLNEMLNPVNQYFKAVDIIELSPNKRFDIYFGNNQNVIEYQIQRGIKNLLNIQ